MTIHLSPTGCLTRLGGQTVEIWRGHSHAGIELVAFISYFAAVEAEDMGALRDELAERPAARWIPLPELIGEIA